MSLEARIADPVARPKRLPVLHGIALALACWCVLALVALWAGFAALDLRLHDWRYRLRGPVAASPRIALVEVDDATIAGYGNWPLPRETYALLVAALQEAGAQAIGFDLLFLGSSSDNPTSDRLLAAVTRGQKNLVHSISFLPQDPTLGGGAVTSPDSREALIRHGRPFAGPRVASAQHVSLPYDDLLDAADALGHTAVAVDRDGVVRRIPQFVRYDDWAFPSLALRLVESAARTDTTLPQFELSEDGLWLHPPGRRRLRVPIDREGATAIVFAGDRSSFRRMHSMLQVLQWYRAGNRAALRGAFEHRLVLVGATALGEVATDVGATPFAEAAPLLFIHANALNAALTGEFESRPPAWLLFAGGAAFAALLGGLFALLPLGVSALLAIASAAAIVGLDYVLFVAQRLDLPPAAALALPPLAWTAVEGYRRVVVEREARLRDRELQIARTIQRRLLPVRPPEEPEFDVFGVNVPAEAVGGDYYDWVSLGENELAVVVGDVSGHGVPAALLMSHLHASFHAQARPGRSPRAIVEAVHSSLHRAVEPGRFATFFLAVLSRDERKARSCNAGHNPPLLVREGKIEKLGATGPPLGILDEGSWTDAAHDFGPGDTLVLYSDGVPECPWKQEFYGEDRLERIVGELAARGLGAEAIGQAILDDVRVFAHGRLHADDVTLVVVRRREPAALRATREARGEATRDPSDAGSSSSSG